MEPAIPGQESKELYARPGVREAIAVFVAMASVAAAIVLGALVVRDQRRVLPPRPPAVPAAPAPTAPKPPARPVVIDPNATALALAVEEAHQERYRTIA